MSDKLEHEEVEDGMHLIAFPPRSDGGNCIVLPSTQCPVCRAEKAGQRIAELEGEKSTWKANAERSNGIAEKINTENLEAREILFGKEELIRILPRQVSVIEAAEISVSRIAELERELEEVRKENAQGEKDWCALLSEIAATDPDHLNEYAEPLDPTDGLHLEEYDPWDALRRMKAKFAARATEGEGRKENGQADGGVVDN